MNGELTLRLGDKVYQTVKPIKPKKSQLTFIQDQNLTLAGQTLKTKLYLDRISGKFFNFSETDYQNLED